MTRHAERRAFLRAGVGCVAVALAGCQGDEDTDEDEADDEPPEDEEEAVDASDRSSTDAATETRTTETTPTVSDVSEDWPSESYGPRNTAFNPTGDGPGGDLEAVWSADVEATDAPVLAGGTVYVPTERGITALDATDGTTTWTYDVDETPLPPTVFAGTVYVATYSTSSGMMNPNDCYALDATDGTELWTRYGLGLTSPTVGLGNVYGSADDRVLAFDMDDGTQLWSAYDPPSYSVGRVTVARDRVYCASAAAKLMAFDASSGELEWLNDVYTGIATTPAYRDETLYFGESFDSDPGGGLLAYDAATGDQRWSVELDERRPNSLAVTDDVIVSVATDETVHGYGQTDGTHRWRVDPGSDSLPFGPYVLDETAYVADDSTVYALDVTTGTLQWEYSFPDLSIPTFDGGLVVTDRLVVVAHSSGVTAFYEA